MPTPAMLIWGVALPLAASAVLWAVWAAVSGGGSASAGRRGLLGRLTAALPVPAAFALAFYAADPVAAFPPLMAVDWLFYAAVALTVVVLLEATLPAGRLAWRVPMWLAGAAVMVVPLTGPWRTGLDADFNPRSPVYAWMMVSAWTVACVVVRGLVGRLAGATPVSALWVLGLSSAVGAVVMGLSGSQFAMPFRTAALGLALLPLLPLVWWWGRKGATVPLPAATVSAWALLYTAVVLAGHLWYALTALNAVLLVAGPGLAGLVPARWPWLRLVVGVLPPLAALGLAGYAFAAAQSVDPYGY
ncbi:MAG: hypothetical protein ACK4PI_12205 [Tepidisphaerales bacterium]